MNKLLKLLALCFIVAVLPVAFTSCGSDDNDEPSTDSYEKLIVGTWAWEFGDVDGEGFVFYSNGKGYEFNYDVYQESMNPFTWIISGGQLIMDYTSELAPDLYTIYNIDERELILYSEYDGELWPPLYRVK